ncbi:MAG: 50S ribosomal protein L25/general stress protein Ctc [Gammaproteobacteria bacterium]|nr:50S ribosomal protein L25/general stress protein Ctc [Gammaproteobacteria bacterium]
MSITLNANVRSDMGKGASRRLRREKGQVPAIMFGGAKNKKPVALTLEHKDVFKAAESNAFYSSVLTINVDGKDEKAILKDMQRHPAKREIMHIDFQRVTKTNPINILVPIKFLNETSCPAVKVAGGRISHQMNEVVVTCLAADIPEFVAVDMQDVPVGGIVHLSDLETPKGVKIKALSTGAKNDTPIANIAAKRGGS